MIRTCPDCYIHWGCVYPSIEDDKIKVSTFCSDCGYLKKRHCPNLAADRNYEYKICPKCIADMAKNILSEDK